MVVIELEDVSGPGERLAPRSQLDQRAKPAVAAELGAHDAVFEHDRFGGLGDGNAPGRLHNGAEPIRRRLDPDQPVVRRGRDLGPVEPDRVEGRRSVAVLRQHGERGVGDRVALRSDLGVVAGGVLVDEGDARPRKDVVKLVQEQELPQLGEPLRRVLRTRDAARDRRQQVGVVERPLALPVSPLDGGVRRVRPAVEFEVELAEDPTVEARVGAR